MIIKMNNEMKKIVKINDYNQPSFKHTKLNKKLFDEKSTLSVWNNIGNVGLVINYIDS